VSAIEQRRLGASGIEVRAVGIGTQPTFSPKKSIELASPAAARRRAVADAGRRRKPPTATDRAGPRAPTASDSLLGSQRQPPSTV
jgi:hypothetical protein